MGLKQFRTTNIRILFFKIIYILFCTYKITNYRGFAKFWVNCSVEVIFLKDYIEKQINSSFNNHSMLLGVSGSGKTHAAKIEIDKYLKKGNKVFLLNFHQKYEELEGIYNPNKLLIDSTDDICIFEFVPNIDFNSEEEKEIYQYHFSLFCINKYESILNLFDRELNSVETKIILDTVVKLLNNIGITKNTYTKQVEFPNLADFLLLLKKENVSLYQEISHFKNSFSSRKTNLTFNDSLNLLTLNTDNLVKGEKGLLIHSLLLIINQNTHILPPFSFVVIDDLSPFLESKHIANKLVLSLKTAKKFNTTYLLIHQSLSKLLEQCGEGILGNCNTVVCFKQSKAETDNLKEYFGLYGEQVRDLIGLSAGQALAFNSSVVAHLIIPRQILRDKI